MFGFRQKRLNALRDACAEAKTMWAWAQANDAEPDSACGERLREALSAVVEHDLDAVYGDAATEADFASAKALLEAYEGAAKALVRRERRARDAAEAPQIARKIGLTRCPRCDGGAMYVRDDVRLEVTNGPNLDVAVVVCAGCGDVRLSLQRRDDLAQLADDERFKWVELPAATPFRGG